MISKGTKIKANNYFEHTIIQIVGLVFVIYLIIDLIRGY